MQVHDIVHDEYTPAPPTPMSSQTSPADASTPLMMVQDYLNYLNLAGKKYAILKIYVKPSAEGDINLVELYQQHIQKHNEAICKSVFSDAGFDVLVPQHTVVPPGPQVSTMIPLGIRCEMSNVAGDMTEPAAFFLMPRSSLSKTPLMQSNSIGLIDSGYRGELMAPVRNFAQEGYPILPHTRLFQLCHPSALPILAYLVENVEDLSSTERGHGGFGSTGAVGSRT